jgi:hypothetical protein
MIAYVNKKATSKKFVTISSSKKNYIIFQSNTPFHLDCIKNIITNSRVATNALY